MVMNYLFLFKMPLQKHRNVLFVKQRPQSFKNLDIDHFFIAYQHYVEYLKVIFDCKNN